MCQYLKKLVKFDERGIAIPLTTKENRTAAEILDEIVASSVLVFREIEKEFAVKRFIFSDASGMSMNEAASMLFYFGDKAKACVEEKLKYVPTLGDVALWELLTVSREVASALSKLSPSSSFVTSNSEFYRYFIAEDLDKALSLAYRWLNRNEKILLRNMLISFLHTQQDNEYKDESALVSTSTSFEFAKGFTGNKKSIVLICWLPMPEEHYAIRSKPATGHYDCLRLHGLPIITSELYENELEVSLIGAIFPHYIYGYYDNEEKVTVLNNNMFGHNRLPQSCAKHGLYIDQSTFKKELKDKTKYSRWAEIRSGKTGEEVVEFMT